MSVNLYEYAGVCVGPPKWRTAIEAPSNLNSQRHMSHEKRAPGWLGYIGDDIRAPLILGDYFINHEIFGSLLTNHYFMVHVRQIL